MNPKQKWTLIQQNSKKDTMSSTALITMLTNIREKPTPENIQPLSVRLRTSDENFLKQFFEANGLQTILEVINKTEKKMEFENKVNDKNENFDLVKIMRI